jgi:GNAT superfamily N-acetyltransferase
MRLHFAAKRYRRWEELSPEATTQARARTLQELYETYGLQRLAASYPEARIRLFLETVLRNAPAPLVAGLWDLVARLRHRELGSEEVLDALASLRAGLPLGPDEDAFLARLSYPHLRPEDLAGFVPAEAGGQRQSEMVVLLATKDGESFRVRHALNPKEVGLLHRLFLQAKLDVRFGPEHRYLVAHGERGQILGGIYYEVDEDGGSAHLEKIAVAERWRKKGVADGLMKELFHRLDAAGVRTLTTGFFRPEFFYAHGFAIDRRYAGLVKSLASS